MSAEAIPGLTDLVRRLSTLGANIPAVAAASFAEQAEVIMTDAKRRTPVDTGALRASGQVAPPVVAGTRASIELGFGGPAAPYAIYVHENLVARHVVGEAKFLEGAVHAALSDVERHLADSLGRELAKLGAG